MTTTDIESKILTLLKTAEDAAQNNENEAAAAGTVARALAAKYDIDIAALQDDSVPDEEVRQCIDFPLFSAKGNLENSWRWDLAWVLCDANGCRPQVEDNIAHAVGRTSDAETVQYLFQYLAHEIVKAAKKHRGEGREFLAEFRFGFIETLGKRIKAERQRHRRVARKAARASPDDTALAKFETALASLKQRGTDVDKWLADRDLGYEGNINSDNVAEYPSAHEAGRRAGKSVPLTGEKNLALGPAT